MTGGTDNPGRQKTIRRSAIGVAIALVAWLAAVVATVPSPSAGLIAKLDDAAYDAFYQSRPADLRYDAPVVVVPIDDGSLAVVDKTLQIGWPWPRDFHGELIRYLEHAGARAVVFDLLFSETSANVGVADDEGFRDAIRSATIPVVVASVFDGPETLSRFAPMPEDPPTRGIVDISSSHTFRDYSPIVDGFDSLALASIKAAKLSPVGPSDQPFLLHYHGPHRAGGGGAPYRYLPLYPQMLATLNEEVAAPQPIDPELVRGKIVLVGITAAGGFDLKPTPLSAGSPGVEVHATAIDNLLNGDHVEPISRPVLLLLAGIVALFGTVASILPRHAVLKLVCGVAVLAAVLAAGWMLFQGQTIRFLAPTVPMLAGLVAVGGGFSYSVFVENRQAKQLFKALETCLSPAVAKELADDPSRLAVGGRRVQATLLFSDLEGFTELTESLGADISPLLNAYLAEMTDVTLAHDGTLDKYIGDAVMAFWNAPVDQPDHAARAIRTAVAMIRREREIAPKLRELGARTIRTRIGIHTGECVVGFTGSHRKLNYTALGDSVNLAARLEGANKLYGSQILVSEQTLLLARDGGLEVLARPLDRLRVKGKSQAVTVYEVLDVDSDDESLIELARVSTQCFEHYLARRFDHSAATLMKLAYRYPNDKVTRTLLERVQKLLSAPPPVEWDGVYVATTK